MHRVIIVVFIYVLCGPVRAGELLEYYVDEMDDHFLLHLDMRVSAKHKQIKDILMDFSKMPEVNNTVVESRLIESEDKKHKIFFVSKGCVWIFCQTIKQVAMVTELDQGYIMSNVIAEESDLHYGRTLWQLIDEGETTRVIYDADYVPGFWVPPFVGSAIAKEKMLSEGRKTINGLERVIKHNSAQTSP
ncbi:MAG: hypothetical protein PVG75_09380 [Thioalkalispiraceae bacterium]|jgi:hypothetical protein